MSKIEIGRFSERLRRVLGMAGQEVVAGELSPEVSPVIVLEDNSIDVQFLQGVRLCQSAMVQPSVVGQTVLFRVRNPVGSAVLAVASRLKVSTSATATVNVGYGFTQADLATAGATGLRDHRWEGPTNPTTLIASRINNVALNLGDGIGVARVLLNTEVNFLLDAVVLPGESLEFGTADLGPSLAVTLFWTERQLPALEE